MIEYKILSFFLILLIAINNVQSYGFNTGFSGFNVPIVFGLKPTNAAATVNDRKLIINASVIDNSIDDDDKK